MVDHPADRLVVSRNGPRGVEDEIPLGDHDVAMLVDRDAGEAEVGSPESR
jgi:hypothetical protein